nr:loricrin-like [Setaria viridis]
MAAATAEREPAPGGHGGDSGTGGDWDACRGGCDRGGSGDGDGDFRPGSSGGGGTGGGGGGACSRGPDGGGDACLGGRDGGRSGHGDARSGARVGGGGADWRARGGFDGGRGACLGTVGEPGGFRDGGARFDGSVEVGFRLCLDHSRSQCVERVRPALVVP